MQRLYDDDEHESLKETYHGPVNPWTKVIRDLMERYHHLLVDIANTCVRFHIFTAHQNLEESMENLRKSIIVWSSVVNVPASFRRKANVSSSCAKEDKDHEDQDDQVSERIQAIVASVQVFMGHWNRNIVGNGMIDVSMDVQTFKDNLDNLNSLDNLILGCSKDQEIPFEAINEELNKIYV